MAANKFATMVHRNSNKITLILIYAILEWTLILLLLLNSLFSYLIIKFADYFGLKPPCHWCSKIDQFLEPDKNHNSLTDHICEHHATEISTLGYCSNHQKLARSQDMCGDCLSSNPGFQEESQKFAFFRMEKIDMIWSDGDKVSENGEENSNCSCCGECLVSKNYSPFVLIDPSWDVLEHTQKGNLITELEIDDLNEKNSMLDQNGLEFNKVKQNSVIECKIDNGLGAKETEKEDDCSVWVSKFGESEKKSSIIIKEEKDFPEILSQHLEFFIDFSGQQLVPIELIDSTSEENHEFDDYQEADVSSELLIETNIDLVNENTQELLSVLQNKKDLLSMDNKAEEIHFVHENSEESKYSVFEMEETENSLVFHAREFDFDIDQVIRTLEEIEEHAAEGKDNDSDTLSVQNEELSQMPITENEVDVSIGTEIPDLDSTDEINAQENYLAYYFDHEEHSTSSFDLHINGFERAEEEITMEFRTLSVEVNENPMNSGLSFYSDPNDMEEERILDTPTSLDSFNQLHNKFLLLERRESGAEESLDGSIISELEGGDVTSTAECLKSALRSERKALHALYAELEEERNASAVAASQTMAMINRLQEEKAAMQMEAMHYQIMMEEQSEYDQEALQLLNELMVKTEREKIELERELEGYKRKLKDYEAKEKMRMGKNGTYSASCSHFEDGDGISIDFNHDAKEDLESFEYGRQESGNHNMLLNFEEERVSILEELKVLEEKDILFEDIKRTEDFYEENGKHFNEHSDGQEEIGMEMVNGFPKELNGKLYQDRRLMGVKAKTLLPLFDDISTESDDGVLVGSGNGNGFYSNKLESSAITRFELEKKRIDIEDEVDQLYGLEGDREFLKHSIRSLKKGDKGMDLLQEILQH